MNKPSAAALTVIMSLGVLFAADKPEASRDQEPAGLILNESAYWRIYFSFEPTAVNPENWEDEARKYLHENFLNKYKNRLKRHTRKMGLPKEDWNKRPLLMRPHSTWYHASLSDGLLLKLKTGFPDQDWHKADFNDNDWLRQLSFYRAPQNVRAAFYRTRFFVKDPSQLKALKLNAAFRGSIRVFINGKEIARRHLPEGALSVNTRAEVYPPESYFFMQGEYLKGYDYKEKELKSTPKSTLASRYLIVPEFKVEFDQFLDAKKGGGEYKIYRSRASRIFARVAPFNRKGFDRIQRERNRTIQLDIARTDLQKGENVLAIETRASLLHPIALQWEYGSRTSWMHCGLLSVNLSDPSKQVVKTTKRQPGTQLWAEDIHRRIYGKEFSEVTRSSTPLRIVAARGGTFSAQAVISTDKTLTGIKTSVDRNADDPFVSRVMYPVAHYIDELKPGNRGRRLGNGFNPRVYESYVKDRFGVSKVPFYEHLGSVPPETIEADTCYPFWISVKVPENTRAGKYACRFTVEAEGMKPLSLPLEITVHDWRIPSPDRFTTIAGLEQSPYALAREFKTGLWTEAHWKLIDRAFSILKRVDNDWLLMPVITHTEFGNGSDSMVRVSKTAAGDYTVDFTILDRYLDIVKKHCGDPLVASFIVMHPGNPGDGRMRMPASNIPLYDASGNVTLMPVDSRMEPGERRRFWKFLSTAIHSHMQSRNLGRATHWGYTWDGQGNTPDLYAMLAEFAPDVYWARGAHWRPICKYYKAVATVYNNKLEIGFTSRKGWKKPYHWLTYPRYWGSVIDCSDYSPPFSFRMLVERSMAAGSRGFSRMGFDFWKNHYLHGMKDITYPVGVPNLMITWPGRDGPETSTRFEMLVEGMQETEAVVFLEQAVDKLSGEKHGELRRRVKAMLDRRLAETILDLPVGTRPELVELCSINWQKRSNALYKTAAEVGALMGLDAGPPEIRVNLPARGTKNIRLPLRNWTNAPRGWSVSFAAGEIPKYRGRNIEGYVIPKEEPGKWLKTASSEGSAKPGYSELALSIDGTSLEPGKISIGKILFKDTITGRSEAITVKVTVGDVMAVKAAPKALNLTHGVEFRKVFTIANNSGKKLEWAAALHQGYATKPDPKNKRNTLTLEPGSPFDWIRCVPAKGTIEPGQTVAVTISAKAGTELEAGAYEASLHVTEAGGKAIRSNVKLKVLIPYKPTAARPTGKAVPLGLCASLVKSHTEGSSRGPRAITFKTWKPRRAKDKFMVGAVEKGFKAGLCCRLAQETVFNIEGKGFKAFAAEVGLSTSLSTKVNLAWSHEVKFNYEIYVDGKAIAMSGLMGVKDTPRLLVAPIPAGARELKMVAREQNDIFRHKLHSAWGNPCFYK